MEDAVGMEHICREFFSTLSKAEAAVAELAAHSEAMIGGPSRSGYAHLLFVIAKARLLLGLQLHAEAEKLLTAALQWEEGSEGFVMSAEEFPNSPTDDGTRVTLQSLSRRESKIMALLTGNLSNKEIASQLSLAPETIKWHLRRIYTKLGVTCRHAAVDKWIAIPSSHSPGGRHHASSDIHPLRSD